MWIASKYGFYSIVRKDGHFHVRARRKKDLVNLQREGNWGRKLKIEEWPQADYRWRIRIPSDSDEICTVFAALCGSITYTNFKSEIAANPDQREKIGAYHEIWHQMAAFQES